MFLFFFFLLLRVYCTFAFFLCAYFVHLFCGLHVLPAGTRLRVVVLRDVCFGIGKSAQHLCSICCVVQVFSSFCKHPSAHHEGESEGRLSLPSRQETSTATIRSALASTPLTNSASQQEEEELHFRRFQLPRSVRRLSTDIWKILRRCEVR